MSWLAKIPQVYKALTAAVIGVGAAISGAAADGELDLGDWQTIVAALVAGVVGLVAVFTVPNKPPA